LVPRLMCGGMPDASRAGTVNKPPPPAMASMNPARKAQTINSSNTPRDNEVASVNQVSNSKTAPSVSLP